ncbi:PREDICTED: autophagy-related protein 9-like [Tarenaya hassleriana]|uniref:autophagy-related protein 9-like n=1 Tax=Tarenaya hassleriana TaxID=28532 RepID=UPI00053CA9BE|nr:PREDICTED: autophagy-related protein 9-like [Tarenaya hassleriana]XP_010557110.1 PREDICTED: autophagy-related protein 9-like [Tarenaya hassleriana]
MMYTGQKALNLFRCFKWKQRGESSSLTTGLLHNVSNEVELSNYGGIPSPGSESPSGLLNGESLSVEPIADLDLFFERLYSYYCDKGIWCIIIKWAVELLSIGFTICFSGFFLLYVNWDGLRNAKCGLDAFESGTKPCDLVKEALYQHPLSPFTLRKAIIVGYLILFSIYWIFCFLRFFAQLKDTLGIRHFYYNSLHVTDNEIQTMPWATVLEKVVQLQRSEPLCVVKDLSAHDIVMRLMRKENYLIGMLNKGVLSFPNSYWIPGAGPIIKSAPDGTPYRLVLTKTLEWTLNWCILQSMFDRNFRVRREFVSNPRTLKKRLFVVGLAMLLLSPFLVIFMLVYLFLKHAEQFYNHPSTASSRRWSNLSKWLFREFNEVDHLFKHRINSSIVHASEYLKQFPSPIISIVAKFISFVSGGFTAVLIIIAFFQEDLLEGHILGRNLFWYAAVFGAITAISRAAISDELLVLDPVGTMSLVVQHTHYMPKRWRGKENTDCVRMEFETLFQYTGMMLLEETASIFLTPFLLMFVVPKRVDDILQFIGDFTVDIEGVGHVCSFSAFDFEHHGNVKYGSPHDVPREQRSSQGKMEKSFLSFQCSYPSWEPTSEGKEFLSKLRTFRNQKLQVLNTRFGCSSDRAWREGLSLRGWIDREIPRNMPPPTRGYHTDSLWLMDPDQRNHPYLLDWYYTSQPQGRTTSPGHNYPAEDETLPANLDTGREFWSSPNLGQEETRFNTGFSWETRLNDNRELSGMETTTSGQFFPESILRHPHEGVTYGNTAAGRSNWWDRGGRSHGSGHQETSFMEPPDFLRPYPSRNLFENLSDRSMGEEETEREQFFDWESARRRLSETAYMDDDIEAGMNLHFDDVYSSRPPETSPTLSPRQPTRFG